VSRLTSSRPARYDWAEKQVSTSKKERQKKSAEEALPLLKDYLNSNKPEWIRQLEIEPYPVAHDFQIPVRVAGLMRVGDELRILVLHSWRKRLTEEQLRAALTIIHNRLTTREELRSARLHLLDISTNSFTGRRTFREIGWQSVTLMDEVELADFVGRLYEAWKEYQLDPAEKPKPRPKPSSQTDMFEPKKPG
jgi:hypothetical protein